MITGSRFRRRRSINHSRPMIRVRAWSELPACHVSVLADVLRGNASADASREAETCTSGSRPASTDVPPAVGVLWPRNQPLQPRRAAQRGPVTGHERRWPVPPSVAKTGFVAGSSKSWLWMTAARTPPGLQVPAPHFLDLEFGFVGDYPRQVKVLPPRARSFTVLRCRRIASARAQLVYFLKFL
jgi:hypothetical protein